MGINVPMLYNIFIWIIALLSSNVVYAANGTMPTAAEMLKRLAEQVPNLMLLMTAFAYVAGIYFIYKGVLELKNMVNHAP